MYSVQAKKCKQKIVKIILRELCKTVKMWYTTTVQSRNYIIADGALKLSRKQN